MKESTIARRAGAATLVSAGALLFLTAPTAVLAATEDTGTDEAVDGAESQQQSASVVVIDDYDWLGDGAGDITEYTIDSEELIDYNLMGIIVDGDFIEPDSAYDESVYDYITTEMTHIDGINEEGLDNQTIMVSASPDTRMLGVYGSNDIGLTPELVNSAVNAMQSEAQEGDFVGAIFTGLDVAVDPIINGGGGDTGAATTTNTNTSSTMSSEEALQISMRVIGVLAGVLVLILGGTFTVKGIMNARDRKRKAREAKEAVEPRLSELQRFWKRADDFKQRNPEASIPDVDTKRALELIREAREVTNSDKQKQAAYVKIHADYMPNDNTSLESLIDYYEKRGDWRDRWSDKMFGVRKNITEASYSVEDFAEIAESETDVQKAKDVVTEAEEQLGKLDADVQSGQSPSLNLTRSSMLSTAVCETKCRLLLTVQASVMTWRRK